jgi:hypothetical protein
VSYLARLASLSFSLEHSAASSLAQWYNTRYIRQWYIQHAWLCGAEAIHLLPWLQDQTAGEPCKASKAFPHIIQAFQHAVAHLRTEWDVQGYLQDQRDQNTISTLMKQHNCSEFSGLQPQLLA